MGEAKAWRVGGHEPDVVESWSVCGLTLLPVLHCRYINSAKLGDEILVDAKVLKAGSRLAFTECELRHKDSDKLVLKASHTKFVG